MLCIGGVPYGLTGRRSAVSCVTEIMLSGVNLFVSLMSKEEEVALQKMRSDSKTSIEKLIFSDHRKARYLIGSTIADTKVLLFDHRGALDALNEIEITAENDVTLAQRKMRLVGRIKVLNDRLKKGEQQQKKLPQKVEWVRIPMGYSVVQVVNDLLPALWELERRIALGARMFLYSRDMHGRVGLLAGCLLGRMYGLTPASALYRLQACHDSAVSEKNRLVPVSCPSDIVQRKLLADVLVLTNRPYEGTYVHFNISIFNYAKHS